MKMMIDRESHLRQKRSSRQKRLVMGDAYKLKVVSTTFPMKTSTSRRQVKILAALGLLCAFMNSSGWATVVTWSLNPNSTEGAVGSTSHTFTSSGYNVTASGYTVGFPNTPLGLYFKTSGADLPGLGIVSTPTTSCRGTASFRRRSSKSTLARFFRRDSPMAKFRSATSITATAS